MDKPLFSDGVGNADSLEHPGSRRPHRNHSPAFKAKVALAALRGDKRMSDAHTRFGVVT